jgi:hypothetical protein
MPGQEVNINHERIGQARVPPIRGNARRRMFSARVTILAYPAMPGEKFAARTSWRFFQADHQLEFCSIGGSARLTPPNGLASIGAMSSR